MSDSDDKPAPYERPDKRFTVGLPEELYNWVEAEVASRATSRRAFIALALTELKANLDRAAASKKDRNGAWRKSDRLLEHLKNLEGWELSCEAAGLSQDEADALQQDPAFMKRVEWARKVYAQKIQQEMLEMGKLDKKFGALQKILEAKDPDYGRLKAEKIQREIGPMLKKLPQYLILNLGEAHRKAIEDAFERFWLDAELHMTSYT